MNFHQAFVGLSVFLVGVSGSALPPVTDDNHITLALDWAMSWGEWGPQVYCPEGSFAYAFELKVETEDATDDTAMNGIKLYCKEITPNNATMMEDPNSFAITSVIGKWGDWRGMRKCDTGLLTGLRMKSEPDQGILDDTAANDLDMQCNWSTETLNGGGDHWGKWSSWESCPHEWAICGIETRVESEKATDDTALNDVRMFCCRLNPTHKS